MTRRKFVGLSVLGAVSLAAMTGHVNRKGLHIDMTKLPKGDELCGVKVTGGGKNLLIASIKDFLAGIASVRAHPGFDPIVPRAPYLSIRMPCGKSVAYRTAEDVPETSVPCTCGNKGHWFLKYEA